MTISSRTIINTVAAVMSVLFIAGLANLDIVMSLVRYTNDHLGGYIAFVFYASFILTAFLLPIVAGAFFEYAMWTSDSRIGTLYANAVSSARNHWAPFVALGVVGGVVLIVAGVGFAAVTC